VSALANQNSGGRYFPSAPPPQRSCIIEQRIKRCQQEANVPEREVSFG
jgi:hypothetical protein